MFQFLPISRAIDATLSAIDEANDLLPAELHPLFLAGPLLFASFYRFGGILIEASSSLAPILKSGIPLLLLIIFIVCFIAVLFLLQVFFYAIAAIHVFFPPSNQAVWRLVAARLLFCADIIISTRRLLITGSDGTGVIMACILTLAPPVACLIILNARPLQFSAVPKAAIDDGVSDPKEPFL